MPTNRRDELFPDHAKEARLNQSEVMTLKFLTRTRLLAIGHGRPLEAAIGVERTIGGIQAIGGEAEAVADSLAAVGYAEGIDPITRP